MLPLTLLGTASLIASACGDDDAARVAPTIADAAAESASDGGGLVESGTLDASDADVVAPWLPVLPELAVGGDLTCRRFDDGRVKCWGVNKGSLGIGDIDARGDEQKDMGAALPTVDLGTGRTARAIVAGDRDACALLDNGSVKCWGHNGKGRLGLGHTDDRGSVPGQMGDALAAVELGAGRTAIAIAGGNSHKCAQLDNGTVKCWGINGTGELGLGDTNHRGDVPGEMGDALPAVNLGTGRTAIALALGIDHSCALLDNGKVKCWGVNKYGELGLGDTNHRGDAPGQMGDALPAVDLGTGRTAIAITAGMYRTCALLDNHTIKCWGSNSNGSLGLGLADETENPNNRGDDPGEMGDALPAVDLGVGRTAVAVSAGRLHTCARLDNGALKCWGVAASGRLGLGNQENRGDGVGLMGDALPAVDLGPGRTALFIGLGPAANHTCVVLDDHSVKCWGGNYFGALGLGDTDNRGDAPGEMGTMLPIVQLQ